MYDKTIHIQLKMEILYQQYAKMRAGDETVSREKLPFYFDNLTSDELQTLIQRSYAQFYYRHRKKIIKELFGKNI